MPEKATYIHGTDATEQHRLVELNRLTNGPFIEFLGVRPDTSAIEVGSGLGILAADVAEAAANVRVVGVELSSVQLPASVVVVASHLSRLTHTPFQCGDDSFDLAYARYLLEHVSDPRAVLAEMRRVLRPGGRVARHGE